MKENTIKRISNNLDLDDIDLSLDIHGDPIKCPGTPVTVRNWPEYDAYPEAYRLCFMRKDKPNNYDEYFRALQAYRELKIKEQQLKY
jgi:hypothetical protein